MTKTTSIPCSRLSWATLLVGFLTFHSIRDVQATDSPTPAPSELDECSAAFVEYGTCINANYCECSDCYSQPDFFDNIIYGGTITCAETLEGYCPNIRCCEPCWEIKQKYSQCSTVDLWVDYGTIVGGACELDCSSYELDNTNVCDEDDDSDDDTFSAIFGDCATAYSNYFTCILQNCANIDTTECNGYDDDEYWLDTNVASCSEYNDILCSSTAEESICCPECIGQLVSFAGCITECDIACADDGSSDGGGSGTSSFDLLTAFILVGGAAVSVMGF
eukprot:Nitzschia sp. Nitz4//scaffold118_size93875//89474//90304//NITZ4_004804-RA/size93875-processed-gene-0.48-mRNA-1//1//CDS//3329533772//8641//frame0